jgi:hypothetical protein
MAWSFTEEPQQSSIVVQRKLSTPFFTKYKSPTFQADKDQQIFMCLAFHPISELSKHVFD